jgi:PAS domain S-box-containing protein
MLSSKIADNNHNENAGELERLKQEKETLSQQVKRLIKAEGKLYEYQEKLDVQLKEYRDLYGLNGKLNATFDIGKIFEHAVEYVIHNLEYERVLIFQRSENTGSYHVCALDGYYSQDEKGSVAGLVVKPDDPIFSRLYAGGAYLICKASIEDHLLVEYGARLLMDEYLLCPLVAGVEPFALLAVGNSKDNADFYRRVTDNDMSLLGVGNLVGLLSSVLENRLYNNHMKKALEQERCAEEKYRGIFENALEGILQTDQDGRFRNCNPATAALLGYASPEELIKSIPTISQLYVSSDRRRELYERIRLRGDVKNFEVEFYRKDGSKQWVLVSIHPVLNENGEILYVDGILQDIAERKKAEESIRMLNEELEQRVIERTSELQTANDELRVITEQLESAYSELKSAQSRILQQEKMASIGQLAAGVAHEINNPMGFIMSNLNSLRKYTIKITDFVKAQSDAIGKASNNGDAELNEIIEEIKKQRKVIKLDFLIDDIDSIIRESLEGAERVKKIVQDMKTFSRIDESEFKAADINAGIESTLNIIWNELKYKAILKREYGNIPLTVCNAGQLNQVFMNILINASQAIEVQGEITVKTWSDCINIYIAISDTGSGIPTDKMHRIFEPFFTTKEVGKGTGLGLSIAYDIVKKHKGELLVQSEISKGTSFTIAIPVVTA